MLRISLVILALLSTTVAYGVTVKEGPATRVKFKTEFSHVSAGQDFFMGVEIIPPKGWTLFWRNPGESGTPPKFKWTLPDHVSASPIRWPHPKKIEAEGKINYVYDQGALLLSKMVVGPRRKRGPMTFVVNAKWDVCRDGQCVEQNAKLSKSVMVSRQPITGWSYKDFRKAKRTIPVFQEQPSWMQVGSHKIKLYFPYARAKDVVEASFFPDTNDYVNPRSKQKLSIKEDMIVLTITDTTKITKRTIGRLSGVMYVLRQTKDGRYFDDYAQVKPSFNQAERLKPLWVKLLIGVGIAALLFGLLALIQVLAKKFAKIDLLQRVKDSIAKVKGKLKKKPKNKADKKKTDKKKTDKKKDEKDPSNASDEKASETQAEPPK